MLAALESIGAIYRHDHRKLKPDSHHLIGPGHQFLQSNLGPLDVLGSLGGGLTYDDVIKDAKTVDLDDFQIKVLDLRTLLRLKTELGRDKDRMAIPILKRLIEETGE